MICLESQHLQKGNQLELKGDLHLECVDGGLGAVSLTVEDEGLAIGGVVPFEVGENRKLPSASVLRVNAVHEGGRIIALLI